MCPWPNVPDGIEQSLTSNGWCPIEESRPSVVCSSLFYHGSESQLRKPLCGAFLEFSEGPEMPLKQAVVRSLYFVLAPGRLYVKTQCILHSGNSGVEYVSSYN